MQSTLNFWGVRGSLSSNSSRIGSHTSCVELDLGEGHSFFLDAGSGIRDAGVDRSFSKITLFISHFHWDHIQGLPFFPPLIHSDTPIEVISCFPDTEERLATLFDPRFHPVPFDYYRSRLKITVLKDGEEIERHGLRVKVARLNHPGDSYAIRLETPRLSFVYATDSDYDPIWPSAKELLKGADLSVMDSQYLVGDAVKKAGYGHASFKLAIDICAQLQIRECVLFHFDPSYSDEQLEHLEKQAIIYSEQSYGSIADGAAAPGLKVSLARENQSRKLQF
jgi:phosphoribosyl 1,2-cyclic phosphodiesterase